MAMPLEPGDFKEALIILGSAAVVVPLFYRMRISPVVGFLLVGALVGPFGLGALAERVPPLAFVTISDRESMEPVAEFGVALLLFMIGLELSFERLVLLRRYLLLLGPAKVGLSGAVVGAVALAAGAKPAAAIVVGLALAMSSTAIVAQVLAQEKALGSAHGRISFAVLLFEDLLVVPVLFAVSMLGEPTAGSDLAELGRVAAQAALAMIAIVALGRLVLRPLFRQVAQTRSPELFMAACLLVVLVTGLLASAAGLSLALGSLIAGLLLAETEYRREIEVTIEPFKGLLLGVFLISVGMGIDVVRLLSGLLPILAGLVGLVVLKAGIMTGLTRLAGVRAGPSLVAGLTMGPAGEFSLIVLSTAAAAGILPPATAEYVLTVTVLSMAAIPLLYRLGERLSQLRDQPPPGAAERVPAVSDGPARVIIAGYGRVGQTVAALLEAHHIPYVAIDADPARSAQARRLGKPVYYGDITRVEMLRRLDLERARGLVVSIDNQQAVDRLVANARAERPDLLIVARARDANHAAHLYHIGATDAVPETIEASLQLSESVLIDLGIPMGPVIASIHEKRAELRRQVQALAPDVPVRSARARRRALREQGAPESDPAPTAAQPGETPEGGPPA